MASNRRLTSTASCLCCTLRSAAGPSACKSSRSSTRASVGLTPRALARPDTKRSRAPGTRNDFHAVDSPYFSGRTIRHPGVSATKTPSRCYRRALAPFSSLVVVAEVFFGSRLEDATTLPPTKKRSERFRLLENARNDARGPARWAPRRPPATGTSVAAGVRATKPAKKKGAKGSHGVVPAGGRPAGVEPDVPREVDGTTARLETAAAPHAGTSAGGDAQHALDEVVARRAKRGAGGRKGTRLNSSHGY